MVIKVEFREPVLALVMRVPAKSANTPNVRRLHDFDLFTVDAPHRQGLASRPAGRSLARWMLRTGSKWIDEVGWSYDMPRDNCLWAGQRKERCDREIDSCLKVRRMFE